jgi:hypothetical protein
VSASLGSRSMIDWKTIVRDCSFTSDSLLCMSLSSSVKVPRMWANFSRFLARPLVLEDSRRVFVDIVTDCIGGFGVEID